MHSNAHTPSRRCWPLSPPPHHHQIVAAPALHQHFLPASSFYVMVDAAVISSLSPCMSYAVNHISGTPFVCLVPLAAPPSNDEQLIHPGAAAITSHCPTKKKTWRFAFRHSVIHLITVLCIQTLYLGGEVFSFAQISILVAKTLLYLLALVTPWFLDEMTSITINCPMVVEHSLFNLVGLQSKYTTRT
ncbi:unnamed protein product [Periconia digitata]|uniref:Uncharacterized protein n=1 Tax=Periconia digitata TaxID=1303443 RepID=A0A9W4ULD0_9PLEO|nr:unnamed protein product [Periconia digitata]